MSGDRRKLSVQGESPRGDESLIMEKLEKLTEASDCCARLLLIQGTMILAILVLLPVLYHHLNIPGPVPLAIIVPGVVLFTAGLFLLWR
jgi:hypothetical protein